MKNLFKKLVGIAAALGIVLTLAGPGVTALAAPVEIPSYTWEYKNTSGGWTTISDTFKASIASLYYDEDTPRVYN